MREHVLMTANRFSGTKAGVSLAPCTQSTLLELTAYRCKKT
jgi:hypothetical protein